MQNWGETEGVRGRSLCATVESFLNGRGPRGAQLQQSDN